MKDKLVQVDLFFLKSLLTLTALTFLLIAAEPVWAGEQHERVSPERLPSLLKELDSGSLENRVEAMEDIAYILPVDPVREKQEVLCRYVSDPAPEMREMALKTIWRTLEASSSVESCIAPSFDDKDERVVRASIIAIGRLFAESKRDFAHLPGLTNHANPEIAYRAAETLGRLGTDRGTDLAIQTFVKMLDKRVTLESEEVYVLTKKYAPAIEVDKLGNRNPEIVSRALSAPSVRESVVPALVRTIQFRKPLVRVVSAKVMKWMKFASPQIIESLFLRLKDDKAPAVRIQALEATVDLLQQQEKGGFTVAELNVEPETYRKMILSLTRSAYEDERIQAARVLGVLRDSSAEVVQVLVSLLNDQSEKVRVYSLSSISKLGPNASSAVPQIEAFLEKENNTIRDTAWAVKALMKIATPRSVAYAEKVIARIEKEEKARSDKE